MKKWIPSILIAVAGCCETSNAQQPLCEHGRCDVVRDVVRAPSAVASNVVHAVVNASVQAIRSIGCNCNYTQQSQQTMQRWPSPINLQTVQPRRRLFGRFQRS